MPIEMKINTALKHHDNVVVTGENQGKILEVVEKMSGEIGRTLSTGAVAYTVGKKKVFVGDMPHHPSLLGAARISL